MSAPVPGRTKAASRLPTRWKIWLAATTVGILAIAATPREPMLRAGVGAAARPALRELGRLAGIRDRSGRVSGKPLPVTVQQSGGPLWLGTVATEVVGRDAAFVVADSRHMLRLDMVGHTRGFGLVWRLWRRGWELRNPRPHRLRLLPSMLVGSAVTGAAVAVATTRAAWGLMMAGLGLQLLLWGLPWAFPRFSASTTTGPLWHRLEAWTRGLPEGVTALAIGVLVCCLVLMVFDHWRSRGRASQLGVRRAASMVLGVIAVLAWIEGAWRSGLGPWLHTWAGWVGSAAILGAWAAHLWGGQPDGR